METKVEGINIVVKDQKISLEIEEARKLFLALKGFFEPVTQIEYPVPMPVYPACIWLTYTVKTGAISYYGGTTDLQLR